MKANLFALALAAATSIGAIFTAQAGAADAGAPATRPANTDIPVRRVVLFSSGVGYFENAGTVAGDASTQLSFKTAQINDILKSLILEDLDGGSVAAVTYPSQDPLEKRLRSFQVDIAANPTLADLLKQLRGAVVKIDFPDGTAVSGTILGVEVRPKAAGKDQPVIATPILTVLHNGVIRAVDLTEIASITLADPKLQEELTAALSVLSQARDQDKKPVVIDFNGQGERRVRIGYVVEAPVWKTSYRLMLPDDPKQPAKLQGWAIVENQTDSDWNNVSLSLVSGRPISFVMNLYQPLYLTRPVVEPELYASLRPRQYAEAQKDKEMGGDGGGRERRMAPPAIMTAAPSAAASNADGTVSDAPMDPSRSVQSAASGAAIGELFSYDLRTPVTLARQKSAMIPIITSDIDATPLSIYNSAVLPRNPLNGARLKNTTGSHLLSGPITVLRGGTYAGDATIGNVPPDQSRLVSFGIDQQLLVDRRDGAFTQTIQTGRIVKGVLELTTQYLTSTDYEATNQSKNAKTLLIEHPIQTGWDLVQPAEATEKTDSLYRFERPIDAGKSLKLTVQQRHIAAQSFALLDLDIDRMIAFSREGAIPKELRDALVKAIGLKQALAETQRTIAEGEQRLQAVQQDQGRIRTNLQSVASNTKFYAQQMDKMSVLESKIEKIQSDLADQRDRAEGQRKELEGYLSGLNLG